MKGVCFGRGGGTVVSGEGLFRERGGRFCFGKGSGVVSGEGEGLVSGFSGRGGS